MTSFCFRLVGLAEGREVFPQNAYFLVEKPIVGFAERTKKGRAGDGFVFVVEETVLYFVESHTGSFLFQILNISCQYCIGHGAFGALQLSSILGGSGDRSIRASQLFVDFIAQVSLSVLVKRIALQALQAPVCGKGVVGLAGENVTQDAVVRLIDVVVRLAEETSRRRVVLGRVRNQAIGNDSVNAISIHQSLLQFTLLALAFIGGN